MAHKSPKTEARVYLSPEQHQHLKAIAVEQGISLSELICTAVLKKHPMAKSKRTKTACNVCKDERIAKEQRLAEINLRLDTARKGNHLPKEEYFSLCNEQKSLQQELGLNPELPTT